MIGLTGLANLPPAARDSAGAPTDTPSSVRQAAAQFEALLIAQMLRHIRESGTGGWLGEGDDQAAGHMMGLAEEQLAQAMASQGGLGLAALTAGSILLPADTSNDS
jgi:Rod binding domain-containing protein